MNETNRIRILYFDHNEQYGCDRTIDGVEVICFAGFDDSVKKWYNKHRPFNLIGLHYSDPNLIEIAGFIRERDRRVPIYVVSGAFSLQGDPMMRDLENRFPSCDGIIWKDRRKQPLEEILMKLVNELRRIESVQRELQKW